VTARRIFYGWVVLAAAFAIITLSIGTLFTLGAFMKPMEDAMGWSRSGIGAIGLLNWIVMGLGGVLAGYLSDRIGTLYALVTREYFGERVLGTAYGIVFSISCIGMGLGSWAGGVIHDGLGSYQWLFLGSVAVGAMAVILALTLQPPSRVSFAVTAERLAV
jgi:MFS family permease